MTTAYRIEVIGLAEFKAAIKEMDDQLPKHLRVNLKRVADVVVQKAQAKLPSMSGKARASLKPAAGTAGKQPWAGIRRPKGGAPWQGVKADYEPWLDFGGSTGRGHKVGVGDSGAIKRPINKGGSALYPAIAETAPFLASLVDDAIVAVAREAGFDVEGSA